MNESSFTAQKKKEAVGFIIITIDVNTYSNSRAQVIAGKVSERRNPSQNFDVGSDKRFMHESHGS